MDKEIEKIVYGKRRHLSIFFRKINHRIFLAIQFVHRKLIKKDSGIIPKTILVYPAVSEKSMLAEILTRMSWTYPVNGNRSIYIVTNIKGSLHEFSDLKYQYPYYKGNSNIYFIDIKRMNIFLNTSEILLVYKSKCQYSLLFSKNFSKVKMIDPFYFSVEESNHMKFGYYNTLAQHEKAMYRSLSELNFAQFKERNKRKEEAYIFVTGPSFNNYKEFTYKQNSLKIVCNTIVKDDEFLEYIGGPDIIAFADPAFHFSTNLYAKEFRDLVVKNIKRYNSYILVPQATVPLLVLNYPEIRDKIIGLSRSGDITIPSENNLKTKPTGSIITFMMIPFASAFAKQVYIVGADGRQKKENYFWKHNDKVQLTSLMEAVYTTHPSFFRDRDYSNHYRKHCKYFEELLEFGEKKHIRYYSLTNSFIPALQKRTFRLSEYKKQTEFEALPGVKSDY